MFLLQLVWTWMLLWLLADTVLRRVRRHCHRPAALLHRRLLLTCLGCALVPWVLLFDGVSLPVLPGDWRPSPGWPPLLLVVLTAGLSLGLGAVALENSRLRRVAAAHGEAPLWLQREAKALAPLEPSPTLQLQADPGELPAPCTFGWWRPTIVLPTVSQAWSAEQRRIVLLHELAHIERRDWLWERMARVLRWSLWWLPPAAALYRELRTQAEHAADDRVMAQGVGRLDYAECLLRFARRPMPAAGAAAALLEPGAVAVRAFAILDGSRVRRTGAASDLPFLLALVLGLVCAAGVRLAPQPGVAPTPPQWRIWHLPPLAPAPGETAWEPGAPNLARDKYLPPAPPRLQLPPLPELAPVGRPAISVELRSPLPVPRPLIALAPLSPEYPPAALRRGKSGVVTVRFDVAGSGRPVNIAIVASDPPGVFDSAVRAALARARFHRDTEAALLAQGIELQFKFVPNMQED